MLAWKLHIKPWEVDKADCTDIDALLIILRRVMELQKGEEEIMEMLEG